MDHGDNDIILPARVKHATMKVQRLNELVYMTAETTIRVHTGTSEAYCSTLIVICSAHMYIPSNVSIYIYFNEYKTKP